MCTVELCVCVCVCKMIMDMIMLYCDYSYHRYHMISYMIQKM